MSALQTQSRAVCASLWHAMHAKLSSSLIKTMFVYSMVCTTGALYSARLSVIRKKKKFRLHFIYRKVASCNTFRLEAHAGIRIAYEGDFGCLCTALWSFDIKLIFKLVTGVSTGNSTVYFCFECNLKLHPIQWEASLSKFCPLLRYVIRLKLSTRLKALNQISITLCAYVTVNQTYSRTS
jgi:hypothetical protein